MNQSNPLVHRQTLPLEEWQAKNPHVYLLVEASLNAEVVDGFPQFEQPTRLYWGEMGRVHASVSPYLLTLEDWSLFEKRIAHQSGWGVFITLTPLARQLSHPKDYLLNHLREWTLVEPPEQKAMILRLADFEVLKRLCAASLARELNALFGPVAQFAYWQAGSESVEVLTAERSDQTLPHRSPQVLSAAQYQALHVFASRHQ